MNRCYLIFLFLGATMFLVACDGSIQVDGTLVSSEGKELSKCRAQWVDLEDRRVLWDHRISDRDKIISDFEDTVTVGSGLRTYVVRVFCQDHRPTESAPFEHSGVEPPVHLGDIVLEYEEGYPAPPRARR